MRKSGVGILGVGENIVIRGKAEIKSPFYRKGELLLTNLRLLHSSREGLHVIPLDEVTDAWADSSLFSKRLYVEAGGEVYEICVKNPEKWASRIETCVERLGETSKYLLGVEI